MTKPANIRAEALHDQIVASLRDGEPMPDGPIESSAARCIPDATTSNYRFNEAQKALLESWALEHGVDRPSGEGE